MIKDIHISHIITKNTMILCPIYQQINDPFTPHFRPNTNGHYDPDPFIYKCIFTQTTCYKHMLSYF